ncbi:MAG TPA: PQQ-binding-like beta-propeller repeat protein [Terriglobales bacterium]|nr:PQQ-binding-like beta-propeller repeat protein [Terriglobales bacterium]
MVLIYLREIRVVTGMLSLSWAGAWAAGPEWPRFRGPDANPAVANGRLPEKWSKSENVEWVAEIPGRGWSSPIVSGRNVFLTAVTTEGKSKPPQTGTEYSNEYAAELTKQGLSEKEVMERVTARDIELPREVMLHYYLYCLDLETGRVGWKREYYSGRPPGGRHRKNSFASETPVTDGKLVYVYVGNMGLYAYDMNGTQVWRTPLEAYPIYLDFGTGGSPALLGDLLLIVNDNEKQQFIAAFDRMTGKPVWRTNRDLAAKGDGPPQRSGWATPFVWNNSRRTEIVTVGPGAAVSYDAAGKELWRLSGMSALPIPSPFAYEGLLYVNGGWGKALFAIKPGATGTLTAGEDGNSSEFVVWSQPRGGTYLPTEVAYEGALYALSETGILSRFEAKTGKLSYRSRVEVGGAFTSSPWAYNGKVFCLSEEGNTFVIAAGEKFELLHVNPLDEMAQATPAIAGDRLLLRTESRLYSIRTKN